MPNQEHERERERDQTHSCWYMPSAQRVNYSRLDMESAGMMELATGEGSPSGRVPEQGPDWFLVATEAYGGGTPHLLFSWMFPGIWTYIGERSRSGEPRGAHEGGGAPRG